MLSFLGTDSSQLYKLIWSNIYITSKSRTYKVKKIFPIKLLKMMTLVLDMPPKKDLS